MLLIIKICSLLKKKKKDLNDSCHTLTITNTFITYCVIQLYNYTFHLLINLFCYLAITFIKKLYLYFIMIYDFSNYKKFK